MTFIRNGDTLKKIITKHVKVGNIMYDHGDFCHAQNSTSNIEQLWAHLKSIIKNLYYSKPHNDFILFLREAKFRRNFKL